MSFPVLIEGQVRCAKLWETLKGVHRLWSSSALASKRKLYLLACTDSFTPRPLDQTSFIIASLDSANKLLLGMECKVCRDSVTVRSGKRAVYSLAVKMVIACAIPGDVTPVWSSPCIKGEREVDLFIVNVLIARAGQARDNRQSARKDVCHHKEIKR